MYRYDEFDRSLVEARVTEFSGQVERRLKGDLTEEQFRPLRLMNGLYLQLHAYMLRVAIPYGALNSRQMDVLASIAKNTIAITGISPRVRTSSIIAETQGRAADPGRTRGCRNARDANVRQLHP